MTMSPQPSNRNSSEQDTHPTHASIRKIESAQDLDTARAIFERDWGQLYADRFRYEAEAVVKSPPSAILGLYLENGTMAGVGVILKEGFDYAYWSITWVMIDIPYRSLGFGKSILDSLLDHAKAEQAKSHNPNCRILLSSVPEQSGFYEKRGFKIVVPGPGPDENLMYLDLVGPGLPIGPLK